MLCGEKWWRESRTQKLLNRGKGGWTRANVPSKLSGRCYIFGERPWLGAATLSKMTFGITTLSIKGLYVTLSINDTQNINALPICWVSLCWVSWLPHLLKVATILLKLLCFKGRSSLTLKPVKSWSKFLPFGKLGPSREKEIMFTTLKWSSFTSEESYTL